MHLCTRQVSKLAVVASCLTFPLSINHSRTFNNQAIVASCQVYDRKRFLDGGLRHHELYFPDGSCPSEAILMKFLEIAEHEPGALAIHCKAGLGRTGVLICSYLMKHYRSAISELFYAKNTFFTNLDFGDVAVSLQWSIGCVINT